MSVAHSSRTGTGEPHRAMVGLNPKPHKPRENFLFQFAEFHFQLHASRVPGRALRHKAGCASFNASCRTFQHQLRLEPKQFSCSTTQLLVEKTAYIWAGTALHPAFCKKLKQLNYLPPVAHRLLILLLSPPYLTPPNRTDTESQSVTNHPLKRCLYKVYLLHAPKLSFMSQNVWPANIREPQALSPASNTCIRATLKQQNSCWLPSDLDPTVRARCTADWDLQ